MKDGIARWLSAPQKTNRQALFVGVVGGLLTALLIWVGGKLLDLAQVVDFQSSVPVWLAAALVGLGLAAGLLLAAGLRSRADQLEARSTPDTASFRRLVEKKISADEYVERLDQRVRDRQEAEERPARAVGPDA